MGKTLLSRLTGTLGKTEERMQEGTFGHWQGKWLDDLQKNRSFSISYFWSWQLPSYKSNFSLH